MRLTGVTGEVAGLWENSGSFGEVVNRFLQLCLSMCDTRPGWNCSLVINLGLAYPKILESMKGGSGETRSHYRLFNLMIICVAWSSQWRCQEVQFPWLGRSRLRGQEISLGSELWACSSCIPESGRHWCARVEKPHSWLGSPAGHLFSILCCVLSMPYPNERNGGAEPSAHACTSFPLSKALFLQPGRGPGREWGRKGTAHLPQARARRAALFPPATGRTWPWSHSTFLFPNSSAASGSQKPHLWHTHSPFCCRKPWFGVLGGGSRGTGAPQGAALPAADGAGP